MYTGLKHLHVLLVVLFLLSVIIKAVLLFTKSEKFTDFRSKTRLSEMIISILFLVTGVILVFLKGGSFHSLFWVKIAMVLAGIPLAIVGFKKQLKIPAMLGTFLFIMAYGVAEMAAKKVVITNVEVSEEIEGSAEHGLKVYQANCISCHGQDGKRQLDMASDLSTSTLTIKEVKSVLISGRGNMPKFVQLTVKEQEAVAQYVLQLRSN